MKKQLRYKKSRAKNLAKSTSFSSNHQGSGEYGNNLLGDNRLSNTQEYHSSKSIDVSSKKMKKNFYTQEDNLVKESVNLSKDKLISKNQSESFVSGQYEKDTQNNFLKFSSNNREKNQTFSGKENHKKKLRKQIDKFQKEEQEVYDPLSKDMDNDGVIDRYDVDFRDSKVSHRTLADDETYDTRQSNKEKIYDEYVKNPKSKNKRYKHYAKDTFLKESPKSEKQKKYVRSNFDDKEFTRNKDTKKNSFQDVNDKRKTADKHPSQKKQENLKNKKRKSPSYSRKNKGKSGN